MATEYVTIQLHWWKGLYFLHQGISQQRAFHCFGFQSVAFSCHSSAIINVLVSLKAPGLGLELPSLSLEVNAIREVGKLMGIEETRKHPRGIAFKEMLQQ